MSELPPHPGMPRWVKAFGLIALLLLLLIVVLHFTGYAPRGHGPSSTTSGLRAYPWRC